MNRLWLSAAWRDGATAVVLSVALVLELALTQPAQPTLGLYLLGLAITAPLALRGRYPVLVGLGIQAVAAAGAVLLALPDSFALAISVFILATYSVASGPRTWPGSITSGFVSMVLLGIFGGFDQRFNSAGSAAANVVYGMIVWAVAAAVRVHRDRTHAASVLAEQAVATSESRANEAVRAERARIAKELHDVVAHALSVVVLRARGGLHEPGMAGEGSAAALRDVEEVAARALADMRHLLALVHDTHDEAALTPQPTLADLPDLVRQVSSAGVETHLCVAGPSQRISPGLALSAYRVVQEALTNVLRHSAGATAHVNLSWRPEQLTIEVVNNGHGNPQPGTGLGLPGLRERVELFGGTFDASPSSDGSFHVTAVLPVAR